MSKEKIVQKRYKDFFVGDISLDIEDDYVSLDINHREILSIRHNHKREVIELLDKLLDVFDFSFYLEFENLQEMREFINT